jgi:putative molybdopterin biosynthesis protein
MPGRLLKYGEVADLLGVGRTTVYDLVGKGELPIVKIGRCARVRPNDLEAFIDARVTRRNR